ncbi:MAG TPA: hypothetical protein VJB14_03230, partial [Planctomycetota bacterium]|nr:hypothetical protein [Planctomycetota bacterium]
MRFVLGILGGILVLAVAGQAFVLRETRHELEEMRAKVDRLETRQKETVASSGRSMDEVREQLA